MHVQRAFSPRTAIHLAAVLLGGAGSACYLCPVGPYAPPPVGSFEATLTLDVDAPGHPFNRLLLGTGVEWQNRGDQLMTEDETLNEPQIARALEQGFTVLRYPGGTLQDSYHFEDGLGPMESRGKNQTLYPDRRKEKVLLGTAEALEIARRANAELLFGTNVITGSPEEAARWVRLTNVDGVLAADGTRLARVNHWEVGNEPYLKNDADPSLDIEPEEFGRRAAEQVRAMRAVDPTIRIGVPVRTDTVGGVPLTPYKDFNARLFSTMDADVDFVALHTAYAPFISELQCHLPTTIAESTLAVYQAVEEDMDATRAVLAQVRPGQQVGLAFTEWSALFTFLRGFSDLTMLSFLGALLSADLMVTFVNQPDVVMANHWSLSDNGFFGGVTVQGVKRPAHVLLRGLGSFLGGRVVPHAVDTPTFNAGRLGLSPERNGVPLIHAATLVDGRSIRLVVLNKHMHKTATLQLRANRPLSPSSVETQTLHVPDLMAVNDARTWLSWERASHPGSTSVELPPHAVVMVDLKDALPAPVQP